MNKRYKALLQERADLVKEQKGIFSAAELRADLALTAEEKGRDDAITARLMELSAELAREERRMANEKALVLPAGAVISDVRDLESEKPFASLGEQLVAIRNAAVNPGQTDPRLYRAATGNNEAVGSDGGFALDQQFERELLNRTYQTGELAQRVTKRLIGAGFNGLNVNLIDETSRADGSRFGGVRAYWVGEGGSYTGSRPKMRRFTLNLEKLTGLYYATDELLQDAVGLASEVQGAFEQEFTFAVDEAIMNGSGAGAPLGILAAPALVSVTKETGQPAATFKYENALKMWSRMWAPSRRNAVWFINQDVEPQLNTMSLAVGTGGVPVYLPAGGLSGQPFATLFGRPVIPVEHCATLGTVGDVVLADLSQYRWIDKGGTEMASSIHVAFTTGEQAFRFTYRANGAPFWAAALTPKNGSNTLSPFVALATRA